MANDTAKRLLARVRELREARGLSQESFAERAGLKYKHYQSIEAGRKSDIRFSTLEKLAKACRLELRELLDFDAAPLAVAEDPAKHGFQKTPEKVAHKSPKRRSGEK